MRAYVRVHMRVCVCVCVRVLYISTYVHLYTYTRSLSLFRSVDASPSKKPGVSAEYEVSFDTLTGLC